MTDNLRDRIVAAVADELRRQATRRNEYSFRDTPLDDEGNDLPELIGLDTSIDPAVMADAVIEALGLQQEYTVEYTVDGCTPPLRQRYEWSCGHERITEHRDQAQWDAKSFAEKEPDEKPSVVTRYVTEWEADV